MEVEPVQNYTELRKATIRLPYAYCIIADFPLNSTVDCTVPSPLPSDGNLSSFNETVVQYCYSCPTKSRFLFGEATLSNHGSSGHVICIILWILTVLIGAFGIFSNMFIISVVKRRNNQRTFDSLLVMLASFDLLTSVTVIICTTASVVLIENWDVSLFTVCMYFIPLFLCIFGRTGSAFTTVLITIERYLVISHPMKSATWFTASRTKLYAIGTSIIALLLNIPRFSSVALGYNHHGQSVPSLRGMKWIIFPTELELFWYYTLKSVHYQIDIWLPFPLLLIFNILLFLEIRKFTKKRQELSSRQRKDIRAARMFLPVVILLFLCNLEPIIHYIVLHFEKIYYRELYFGFNASMAMNAAVNLPIYYARGSSFREEIRAALPSCFRFKFLLGPSSAGGDLDVDGNTTGGDKSVGGRYRRNRGMAMSDGYIEQEREISDGRVQNNCKVISSINGYGSWPASIDNL